VERNESVERGIKSRTFQREGKSVSWPGHSRIIGVELSSGSGVSDMRTPLMVRKARQYRQAGLSFGQIAEIMGLSKTSVYRRTKDVRILTYNADLSSPRYLTDDQKREAQYLRDLSRRVRLVEEDLVKGSYAQRSIA